MMTAFSISSFIEALNLAIAAVIISIIVLAIARYIDKQ